MDNNLHKDYCNGSKGKEKVKYGFNHIHDEAKEKLEDLGVPVTKDDNGYWDVLLQESQDDYGTKTWRNPLDGTYWYMFREKIFFSVEQHHLHIDERGQKTNSVETVLRFSNDQDLHRSVLEARPPALERPI